MQEQQLLSAAQRLVDRCGVAMVGVNGGDGYPQIKAMFKAGHEGLHTFWFSTNTSSQRVRLLLADGRASIYFCDHASVEGLMLVGEAEVITDDLAVKQRFWWDGCEKYYPLGVSDPDYSVVRFVAKWGRYYHQLQTASFEVAAATAGGE